MKTDQAAEHLQTIRTLMERSALYRRALAPIMSGVGFIGFAAGLAGWLGGIESVIGFTVYWLCVAIAALTAAFLLVRRQALKDKEAFWSPPTRRIAQAMLPPLAVGFVIGVCVIIAWRNAGVETTPSDSDDAGQLFWLPAVWTVFYGCAIHTAGFFTPRGLRWFGWALVAFGCALFLIFATIEDSVFPWWSCHLMMSFFFGASHLAYGIYLTLTQSRKNAA